MHFNNWVKLTPCALALLVCACSTDPMTMDTDMPGESEMGESESETGDGDGDGDGMPEPTSCGSMLADDCPWEPADLPLLLPQACGFEQPCGTLEIIYAVSPNDDPVVDKATYECITAALRDGQAGRYLIEFDYSFVTEFEIFEILPERRAQWAHWTPGDTGECSWNWETRELLEADAYQACFDASSDPSAAVECFENLRDSPPSCFPLDEIDCGA